MLRLLPSLLQGVSSLEGIKLLKVSRAYVTCACACTCACECRGACASRSEIRVACWHSAQTQTCNNGVGALFCFNTVRSQPLTHLVVQAYVFREHALACRQSRGS